MNNVLITVFTSTYNRGYIIEKLYKSLKKQTSFNFEWLVIDDGSNDDTRKKFDLWTSIYNKFDIRYYYKENGGKPRAINDGVKLAKGRYFFMIDSDDYILPTAIEKLEQWIKEIDSIKSIVAVGAARGYPDYSYIKGKPPKVNLKNGYIDATNLERSKYDLDADMCEAYKVDILKKFPFNVWEKEKFAPEEITLNEMALAGYKVRWHKDIIYICDYLEDGLTKGSWNLMKNNPMGYAMLYNHKLKYTLGIKNKIYNASEFIAYALLGNEIKYIKYCNDKKSAIIAFPIGIILYFRRKVQFGRG